MCYALFIAADRPLDLLEVDDAVDAEVFHLEEPQPQHAVVQSHLSKPHVYYAASWQGCGCGWFPNTILLQGPKTRRQSNRRTAADVRALGALLSAITSESESVELYLSWEGELDEGVKRQTRLVPSDFEADALPMEQGDLAIITGDFPS